MATNTAINSGANGSLAPSESPEFTNLSLKTAGEFRTAQVAGNTMVFTAHDVDGVSDTAFITLTANNTPSMNINTTFTLDAGVDMDMAAGAHAIGASVGANNLSIGGATSTVVIPGNLDVQGTTTTIGTTNLDVKDKNITVNVGGTTAGTTGAGITYEGDGGSPVGYMQVASGDNANFEFNAPGNAFVLTLDINDTKTLTVNGDLNVEADSAINQDVTTDADVLFANVDVATGGALRTGTTATNTALLQAYDVDGTAYTTFATLTAGNTPTMALSGDVTTVTQAPGTNTAQVASCAFVEAAASSTLEWVAVTGTTQAMAVNKGYITDNVALVTATLPATIAAGEIVRVAGKGAGGWKIAQNAGQTIHYGSAAPTTTGITGYLESTATYDMVELLCITDDTDFVVLSSVGVLNTDV